MEGQGRNGPTRRPSETSLFGGNGGTVGNDVNLCTTSFWTCILIHWDNLRRTLRETMLFLSNVVKYLRISCNFSLKPIQWFLVFTALIMSLHSKAFSVSIQLPKSSWLFYKSLGQHTETRNWGCPQEWCPWEYRLRMVEARNFGLLSQPNFRDKPGWPPFASWLVICKQPTAIEGFWGYISWHFRAMFHMELGPAGSSWVAPRQRWQCLLSWKPRRRHGHDGHDGHDGWGTETTWSTKNIHKHQDVCVCMYLFIYV